MRGGGGERGWTDIQCHETKILCSLTYLIGEKPHHELFNFLKDASFYHDI